MNNEKSLNALITIARLAGKLSSKEAAILAAAVPLVADLLEDGAFQKLWDRLPKISELVDRFRKENEPEKKPEPEPIPEPEPEPVTPGELEKQAVAMLHWTKDGDPHDILDCYSRPHGYPHDFTWVADLPIDFRILNCQHDGIWWTEPSSDDNGFKSYGEHHMEKRRGVIYFFKNGRLIGYEDCSGELSFYDMRIGGHLDNGATHVMIIHCQHGRMVSRTALTGV